MNVPVVLTTVRVDIEADGTLAVEVDGEAYAACRSLTRSDLRSILAEITTHLGVPVRVEVHEADDTTYTDIETPLESPAPAPEERPSAPPMRALAGAGFEPGEDVALAYIVTRQPADPTGHAALNLPPALIAVTRSSLVLIGLDSRTVAPVEPPA